MQSITKAYLADIIYRAINQTIQVRRASQKNHLHYLNYPTARQEEILDFIQSMPYFDEQLKFFLMGTLSETTIIISQNWETAFIVKCNLWAHSNDWLHKDTMFSIGFYPEYISRRKESLTLPY